jgi:MFS family permease
MSDSVVELLRSERDFRRLWLAQVVSELGDWFQLVALISMFPTRGSGASVVAGLVVARNLVAALSTPFAGVLADRLHRGRVMIVADLARAALVLGFFLVRGPEDVTLVFGLSLGLEALSVAFEPARGAAIPQLLPPEKLFAANALGGATWSAMLALGSMAGGAATALFGRRTAFALNALSFVASALLVASARVPPLPAAPADAPPPHPLRDVADGLRHLRDNPSHRALLVLKPGALLSGGVWVLVSVFADQVFSGDRAMTMGWLLAGRGLGALVVPFVVARFVGRDSQGVLRALAIAFPLSAVGFLAFSGAPSIPWAALALVVAHGGTSTAWIGSAQLLQLVVPNRVLGRVLSVELMLLTGAIALSSGFVALLVRAGLSPREVGALLALLLVLPWAAWSLLARRHAAALVSPTR